MSDDPGDDLPDDLREFLRAEQSRPALPPEQVAQIRRKTEQSVALGSSAQSTTLLRRWVGRSFWLFIGITLGAAGSSLLHPNRPMRTQALVRIVYIDAMVPREVTAHVDAAAPSAPTDATTTPSELRGAHINVSPLASDRTERALVERARSALLRHDDSAAIDAAQEHARRFPSGALREEREALWIRALVRVGRSAEARAKADAFAQRWPRSLLLPSIEAAVRATADSWDSHR